MCYPDLTAVLAAIKQVLEETPDAWAAQQLAVLRRQVRCYAKNHGLGGHAVGRTIRADSGILTPRCPQVRPVARRLVGIIEIEIGIAIERNDGCLLPFNRLCRSQTARCRRSRWPLGTRSAPSSRESRRSAKTDRRTNQTILACSRVTETPSRSDIMNVAVGFNPRSRLPVTTPVPKLGSRACPKLSSDAIRARRTPANQPPNPAK